MPGLIVMVTTPPNLRRLVLANTDDPAHAILATMGALSTDPNEEVIVVGTAEDSVLAAYRVPPGEVRPIP
jgi:hypothetical protein